MNIKQATTRQELEELDQLLWDVLWKPLNFKRNVRQSFKLDKPQIDIIAVDNNVIIGALVANWLSNSEIEIRHIAVKTEFQKRDVGELLVEALFKLIQDKTPVTIQTHARSTSMVFFSKLGFKPVGNRLEVDAFMRHGIWLQRMSITK
jgi:N-acetylglutamate synthase-like GNAT family acetyltransferase